MRKFIFNKHDNLIKVTASVSGKNKVNYKIILAIDTGSYHSIIKPEILQEIGCDNTDEGYKLITAIESFQAGSACIQKMSVLGISVINFPVAVATLPDDFEMDGLLGNSFFRNNKLTLDFPNGIISIE